MTYTKTQAIKHFREWYADLKAETEGKVTRWDAWDEFLRVNIEQGHLPEAAKEWVTP
jgi:hypothetical protein